MRLLDEIVPEYEFSSLYSREIDAPPDVVAAAGIYWGAIKAFSRMTRRDLLRGIARIAEGPP